MGRKIDKEVSDWVSNTDNGRKFEKFKPMPECVAIARSRLPTDPDNRLLRTADARILRI